MVRNDRGRSRGPAPLRRASRVRVARLVLGISALFVTGLLSCDGSDRPAADVGGDAGGETRGVDAGVGDDRREPAPLPPRPDSDIDDVAAVPDEVVAHAADWPLPNRDYDNTRASFDTAIDSATVHDLQERWRVPLDHAGPFGHVTAPALVLGDTVYVQDMGSHVYAIGRERGEIRWQHPGHATTVGPNGVAVGWGKVFAGIGDTGFQALALDTGEPLWRFEPELVSTEGVDITPLPYRGSVLVSTVPASLRGPYFGGSRGVLHALDQASGSVRWRFDTIDSEDLWGDPERNSGGGAWYPPLIDPETGMSYWGTGNPAPFPGTAGAPNGESRPGDNLYTSSVVAIDPVTGQLAWYHQEKPHDLFDWDFQASPVRVRPDSNGAGADLVIGAGKTGTVVGLDPLTGELRFRTEVGERENDDLEVLPDDRSIVIKPGVLGGVLTPLAYAEGRVFVPVVNFASGYDSTGFEVVTTDATGELVAIDVATGEVAWSAPLPAPCYAGATVANDLVLTADETGRVYALSRASGEQVWRYDAPAGINAPLTVAGDLLLIPAGVSRAGGSLIALGL